MQGDLVFDEGGRLRLGAQPVSIDGTVRFDGFGLGHVEGLDSVLRGRHNILFGPIHADSIFNNLGSDNRQQVSGRRHAYLERDTDGLFVVLDIDPPAAPLVHSAVTRAANGARVLSFASQDDVDYALEYASDLGTANAWSELEFFLREEEDGYLNLIDPDPDGDNRFYRVRADDPYEE